MGKNAIKNNNQQTRYLYFKKNIQTTAARNTLNNQVTGIPCSLAVACKQKLSEFLKAKVQQDKSLCFLLLQQVIMIIYFAAGKELQEITGKRESYPELF